MNEQHCSECGRADRDLDLRPVVPTWSVEPVLLCDDCYRELDEDDKIDHEADAEYFGWGEHA